MMRRRVYCDYHRPLLPPSPLQFTVILKRFPCKDPKLLNPLLIDDLILSLPSPPIDHLVFPRDRIAARLFFAIRSDALDAVEFLWRCRLDGDHFLIPFIDSSNLLLKSEEFCRVKGVFVKYVEFLLDGEKTMKDCEKKRDGIEKEIKKMASLLRKPMRIELVRSMREGKEGLETELELINGRVEEFRVLMRSVLNYLKVGKDRVLDDGEFDVLRFGRDLSLGCFVRIHAVLVRECSRLRDGLPIYASRRKLLHTMFYNQVTVVIGETGSGKSTQLAQFIADSGLVAAESIVCTQPRKIAVISVAQRVFDESIGCYNDDNFVVSYPAYSSSQELKSRIIFMTDHCLLQHYMGKKNFKGISCIVVDEAHERSLNTDLLLALIKKELFQSNLRVIIMSATADASKLADYFYSCPNIFVKGRNFPVDIRYVPDIYTEAALSRIPRLILANCASYVSDVIMMVKMIHKTEEEGAILAFLTSQMEVEWACENFSDPLAVVLPMHGKLSHHDQSQVMQIYPGKRKVIFCTNVAETSLTIKDVKYVVDSGMVKESRFEPSTGMNVLKVGRISQSSAIQRSGRAGRTGPGKCFRMYSESDFRSMKIHQEPEIHKVHLGIAVLRILALNIKNVQDFDFVDAPDPKAIDKAVQNLTHLGAIVIKSDIFEITDTGRQLVKLDIEPRLGKIILDSFGCGLRKEGLVLAAVMANSSSIFCRVGSIEDKHKADCLKLTFCHRDGDLFTLLSVYKEWEELHESRNKWCWDNSINAKSLRRCQETVMELEKCLRHELNTIIPSYWYWNPHKPTDYDKLLKKILLSSLVENVAMYSGSEQLGYEVALSGQQLQLHPSCSLIAYGQKPSWVVFGEILSVENQYLVCVNAVDYNDLLGIQNPLFDVMQLESRKLSMKIVTVVGNNLLRRFCGKSNSNLRSVISHIKEECRDERISIDVDFTRREIQIFAASKDIEKVSCIVTNHLEREKKWLRDESMEKNLFQGVPGNPPSMALFGSGAGIKHLELDKRYLTVEVFHPMAPELNDKELLGMVEQYASGIAGFVKLTGIGLEAVDSSKWGKITFVSPEAAENAVAKLNEIAFYGSFLKVLPVRAGDYKTLPFSAVRAKVCWPRRRSKGVALIYCAEEDTELIVRDCFNMEIGGNYMVCEKSLKFRACVFASGIPKDVSESELYEKIVSTTRCRILGVQLLKFDAVTSPPESACAEALTKEISPFMPNKHCASHQFQVDVFSPEPKDHVMRAMITYNGSLHLEAAKALDHLQGKSLSGCLEWQKIQCQRVFNSSVSCPARIYTVIKEELDSLLESFRRTKGVTCTLEKTNTRTHRVKISANATKIVADLRKPLEQLTRGKTVTNQGLTPSILLHLLSCEGVQLLQSIERETGTYILYDRQNLNVRIFGPPRSVAKSSAKLVKSLLSYHENKPQEIRLRGHDLPPDLMKEVVQRFGTGLQGLKEKIPSRVELSLNTRRHILSVRGAKESKKKAEEIISEVVQSLGSSPAPDKPSSSCPICLCEIEDPYTLEGCGHDFCRACLVDQCESIARSRDGFPLRCTESDCNEPFLLVDLRSLLPRDKLEELFRASLGSFVASSDGLYRFCPSPDCPSVYRVGAGEPFSCGACLGETCTRCHLEYHPFISCERYAEFKDTPDKSLMEWRKGKEHVKDCYSCGHTIEKIEGCNHVECRCGKHMCWVCLESFSSSDDCYVHLRSANHM